MRLGFFLTSIISRRMYCEFKKLENLMNVRQVEPLKPWHTYTQSYNSLFGHPLAISSGEISVGKLLITLLFFDVMKRFSKWLMYTFKIFNVFSNILATLRASFGHHGTIYLSQIRCCLRLYGNRNMVLFRQWSTQHNTLQTA